MGVILDGQKGGTYNPTIQCQLFLKSSPYGPRSFNGFSLPTLEPHVPYSCYSRSQVWGSRNRPALAATVCNTPPPRRTLSVSPELVVWEEEGKTANQRSIQETSTSGKSLSSHHAVFQSLHIAESSGLALFLLSANPFQKLTRECK